MKKPSCDLSGVSVFADDRKAALLVAVESSWAVPLPMVFASIAQIMLPRSLDIAQANPMTFAFGGQSCVMVHCEP